MFAAAVSDAGFSALVRAVEALEQTHAPESTWTWPGTYDEHGQLDPAGSFRRRPWFDHAAAVYSAADLVENWRECGTTPEDTRHFWHWLDEPNGAPNEYGTRLDGGGDHERADALLVRVLRTMPADGGLSALTVVVEAAGLAMPVEPDRRPAGILPAPVAGVRTLFHDDDHLEVLPFAGDFDAPPPGFRRGEWLAGVEWSNETGIVRAALPLRMFDGAGLASTGKGPGAALPLRVFIEAVLTVPHTHRTGLNRLELTLRDWREWLWANGWHSLKRDWPRLRQALWLVHHARVPWEAPDWTGGEWAAVVVRNIPRGPALRPGADGGPGAVARVGPQLGAGLSGLARARDGLERLRDDAGEPGREEEQDGTYKGDAAGRATERGRDRTRRQRARPYSPWGRPRAEQLGPARRTNWRHRA